MCLQGGLLHILALGEAKVEVNYSQQKSPEEIQSDTQAAKKQHFYKYS